MSKLIVFACFWNEKEWIDLSLKQLKKLNPDEAILCDGCFDMDKPKHSTDGTYQRIKQEVRQNENYKLVDPIRVSFLKYPQTLLKILSNDEHFNKFIYPYWYILLSLYQYSNYRVNQALTFNYMATVSGLWKVGNWVTTYDCDQFYSDNMIENFNNIDKYEEYNLLTANELTFFESFSRYTEDYEHRKRSNMPHRILEDTFFIPTRRIVFFEGLKKKIYEENTNSYHLGNYFHYKFDRSGRLAEAYELGDRQYEKPNFNEYKFKEIQKEEHPTIIREEIS
ncbi:hypothetical protein [Fodinibius saliphilus]|uniref:hypothetical protein n=1 Tax=Fodinibius saliphilus TaxID=1920650 RepID=UPI00110957BC|nr:hypothetical protein [Fodinibius saliphilus]